MSSPGIGIWLSCLVFEIRVKQILQIKVDYSLLSIDQIFKYSLPFVFICILRFNTYWMSLLPCQKLAARPTLHMRVSNFF